MSVWLRSWCRRRETKIECDGLTHCVLPCAGTLLRACLVPVATTPPNQVARIAYLQALVDRIKVLNDDTSFDPEGMLVGRGVGPILASTSCSFKFPLTFPDEALVTASINPQDVHELGFSMSYTVCVILVVSYCGNNNTARRSFTLWFRE